MSNTFFKISAFVTISLISSFTLTACGDAEDGAQGVAGAPGEQGEPGASCTAKKLKDGTGYELKCGNETIGTILNGEQGEPGEKGEPGNDGTSCTVADTTDENDNTRTGYKLICDESLKGVVWNGNNGHDANIAEALDLEFYNRLMLGHKGTSLFWDGNDGENMVIPEGCSGATWNYWTDKDIGGNSGFAFNSATFVNSEPKSDFTSEYISDNHAVGGKVMLKPNDIGWSSVMLQVGGSSISPESNIFTVQSEKMLGLCVEYMSDFDITTTVFYYEEGLNNYARPYIIIPKSTKKTVVNIPWVAFEKSQEWGEVVTVSDALKRANGFGFQVSSDGATSSSGDLWIYKIGAYGTCE